MSTDDRLTMLLWASEDQQQERSDMQDHVHDCTGPDATCHCGYVFTVMPISLSIEVYDRRTELINEAFNCETVDTVIDALRKAADRLEAGLNVGTRT